MSLKWSDDACRDQARGNEARDADARKQSEKERCERHDRFFPGDTPPRRRARAVFEWKRRALAACATDACVRAANDAASRRESSDDGERVPARLRKCDIEKRGVERREGERCGFERSRCRKVRFRNHAFERRAIERRVQRTMAFGIRSLLVVAVMQEIGAIPSAYQLTRHHPRDGQSPAIFVRSCDERSNARTLDQSRKRIVSKRFIDRSRRHRVLPTPRRALPARRYGR